MTFTRFKAFEHAAMQSGVSKPKYRLIRDHFHAEISSGRMAPGSALPTEAELCEMLKMSRNTVRQALGELETEGLVERFPGRGTFVTTEHQKRAHQQLNMFAVITPESRKGTYPSLIHGFAQTCTSIQHETIIVNSGNDIGRQADLIMRLIDQAVGGVAIVPTTTPTTPAHQIRLLQKHHIPVVFCHRTVPETTAPSVIYSGQEVGFKAGRALGELGHRRIAFPFVHRYSMAEHYGEGLQNALAAIGADPAEVMMVEYGSKLSAFEGNTEKTIQQVLTKILTGPNRPTAMFCGNAPDAEVVYLLALKLGLKIPEDLSLVYVGSTWREHGLESRISCVGIDAYEIGARAARLLNEIRSGQRPLDNDEQFVFPATLLPGETLGPAPGE